MKVFGTLMVLSGICSSVSLAQEVHTDYDKKASFSQYHSYYWAKVQTSNPLWEQRIQDAVDRFAREGLEQS